MVGGRLCQVATAGREQLSCADNNHRTNERWNQLDAEQAKPKVPDADGVEQKAANDAANQTRQHRANPSARQLARHNEIGQPADEASHKQRQQ